MESQRITGTEMEWAVMVPCEGQSLRQLQPHEITQSVARWIKEKKVIFHGSPQHCYLANGARFYSDVGDHREYATPEDTSFEGTLANELAGEKIMTEAMGYFKEAREHEAPETDEDESKQRLSLTKRVIDDQNMGSGYHISYSADAERMKISKDDLALFGVFAATRSVLFGAGALLGDGNFVLGQKALTVTTDFSASTVNTKPVVNLRNEALADDARFLRVHDTSSDPNMSPWSTRVKFAAGSLVIKLIEEGRRLPNLRFEDNLTYVTRKITRDISLSERFKMANGRSLTALGVQNAIIREAKKLKNCTDEELWGLEEWEKAVRELIKDPRLVANRVEWFIRLRMLERQHKGHNWSWASQELRSKDRQFSEFMGNGIGQALRETVWADYMPSKDLINERVRSAPSSTRARMRGQFIDFASQHNVRVDWLNWAEIKFQNNKFKLEDPFNPHHTELEVAMKKFYNTQKLIEAIPA